MLNNLRIKLLLWLCLAFSMTVSGQVESKSFLILAKPGVRKTYHFYPGDAINYRLAWNNEFITDKVFFFTDSSIVFASFSPLYQDISAIKIPKKTYIFNRKTLAYSGISMLGSVVIWNAAYLVNQGEFAPETAGAVLFFTGIVGGMLVINLTKKAVTKQIYQTGPGNYELRPVVFRPQPDEYED